MTTTYVDRVWLNKEDSASTGSCVAFCGQAPWKKEEENTIFFEVADCHGKIRLHKSAQDSTDNFTEKLRLLALTATNFAEFIDKNGSKL